MSILILDLMDKVNPVRNSSPAIAGLETERGIISNGVNSELCNLYSVFGMANYFMDDPESLL
jgi:hypothetical protein